jgi:hypothetical protein
MYESFQRSASVLQPRLCALPFRGTQSCRSRRCHANRRLTLLFHDGLNRFQMLRHPLLRFLLRLSSRNRRRLSPGRGDCVRFLHICRDNRQTAVLWALEGGTRSVESQDSPADGAPGFASSSHIQHRFNRLLRFCGFSQNIVEFTVSERNQKFRYFDPFSPAFCGRSHFSGADLMTPIQSPLIRDTKNGSPVQSSLLIGARAIRAHGPKSAHQRGRRWKSSHS